MGALIDLAREARHPILIVNDSDISVPAGYIHDVTAPLADPGIGLVTCLYRAEAHDWPSRFEALAIATDFAPSTLVARLFGVSDFGLGSTLAFRRADLDRIGGFHAIADYIADDYQLGHKLHALGLRNMISEVVVSTRLSSGSWLGAWRHQVRWARTIRLSGGAGYAGLPITYASLWAVIAALFGLWWIALPLLAHPARDGHRLRLVRAAQPGRLEILLCDPAARSVGRRGVGRGLVWAHGGVARSKAQAGRRRKNRRPDRARLL